MTLLFIAGIIVGIIGLLGVLTAGVVKELFYDERHARRIHKATHHGALRPGKG